MKLRYALMAGALLSSMAFAGETTVVDPSLATPQTFKRLSGSFNVGYETNYNGRGLVMSHSVAEGDSAGFAALKYNIDFGKQGAWSWDGALSYRDVPSGHTLYGNPSFGPHTMAGINAYNQLSQLPMWSTLPGSTDLGAFNPQLSGITKDQLTAKVAGHENGKIKYCNIEPEVAIMNSLKYTQEKWNVAFGHDFVHGGILGVMAKHYADYDHSFVNEVFIRPEWTPAKWVSAGLTTRYSFQGVTGYWFEPDVTFKAPIIGTPEDIKLAGVLQFGMSATAEYFQGAYFACGNGTQAFWIKLSTPWFVTDNFILTPSVSFNWLGKGGVDANKHSEFRKHTENKTMVPFRNFGIVGGVSATYRF